MNNNNINSKNLWLIIYNIIKILDIKSDNYTSILDNYI